MSDMISLRDYVIAVEIGAFQEERGVSQRLQFDIELVLQQAAPASLDDVDQIMSYDALREAIETELNAERLNLLETLAERIAARLLSDDRAQEAMIRIQKLDRPPGRLGVEIRRKRSQIASTSVDDVHVRPHIVFLSQEALTSPNLPQIIEHFVTSEHPALFCVAFPDSEDAAGTQNIRHGSVSRRIDLLSLEQNAWRLADHDPRCLVVASRTELLWAMQNGRISIWAPSKMVLDAAIPPSAAPRDAAHLALWLAREFDAICFSFVGAALDPEIKAQADMLMSGSAAFTFNHITLEMFGR